MELFVIISSIPSLFWSPFILHIKQLVRCALIQLSTLNKQPNMIHD